MCGSDQRPGAPSNSAPSNSAPANVADALAMADAAARYLNAVDLAALPGQAQGEALRALEQLDAKLTAAHAKLTATFAAAGGPQADGAYSAKTWLRHHAQLTSGTAGARVGWARRLSAHPAVASALADGRLSPSWARHLCDWTGQLPAEHRQPADQILIEAAGLGAGLEDLAAAAAEIHRRTSPADADDEAARAFPDRAVYLGRTLDGAGRLEGDLTPAAAAAVSAVLDALSGRAGPEDLRSLGQRNHDALAEACRRLIAGGMLPARAGQDTRAEVTIGLHELRRLPGAADAEETWIARITGAAPPGPLPGPPPSPMSAPAHPRLTGAEAAATACDSTVVPLVAGHLNQAALDQLTRHYLAARSYPSPLPATTRQRLQATLLCWAIEVVSGPGGLAAHLRTTLLRNGPGGPSGPLGTRSLPLDVGQASDIIPAHLRRAVTIRDRHCAFPGCEQPPAACHVHHITPRRDGGPAALNNLILLCPYHHLIVIHEHGWAIALNPDASATATSPDGRTLHSHDPPRRTA